MSMEDGKLEVNGVTYDVLTLDYETHWGKDYTLSGKINTSEYVRDDRFHVHGVAIKKGNGKTLWYTGRNIALALKEIDWSKTAMVGHNTAFDGFITSEIYGHKPAFYVDTLSMSRATRGHATRHDLDTVAKAFGHGGKVKRDALANTKDKVQLTKDEEAKLGGYAVDDVDDTYRIFWDMYPHVPDDELRLIDITMRMFCDPVLEIDIPRVKAELENELGAKAAALLRSGAQVDDLMSNDKFARLLQAAGAQLPQKISPSTGKLTYAFAKSDLAFQELMKNGNDKVRALCEARLKVKSTIGETRANRFLEAGRDGMKLPVMLNFSGAHTHRWSGGNRMNLQNLKRGGELRRSILAPKGYVVVVADSAQIEARVLAWLAQQMDIVNAFTTKQDVYKLMASAIYNVPVEDITKDQRFIGKLCIAEGSLVLTNKGLVPIEKVTLDHKVWDGVRWVDHGGVVYQGYKEVITYDGLTATPDHKVYAQGHSLPIQIRGAASSMDRLVRSEAGGQAVRVSEDYLPAYTSQGRLQDGGVPMHSMPDSQTDQSGQPHERQEQWVEANTSKAHVYDILNAGPNRRFTVSGVLVANCILGLGYGMGPQKLQQTLKQGTMGPTVDISEDECRRIVGIYRQKNWKIKAFWKKMDQVITNMTLGIESKEGPLEIGKGFIRLPNGMFLQYFGLHGTAEITRDDLVMTETTYLTRTGRTKLYGGLLTENVVQALSRIIIAEQMLKIHDAGCRIVTMAHDEIVIVAKKKDAKKALDFMIKTMSTAPDWAPDLPLAAEGSYDTSYSK